MISQEQLTDVQKNMANRWKKKYPTVRPSPGLITLYRKVLIAANQNKPESIWGILGCTPELRSLAGEYQSKITCIDWNSDAFYAYKTLCKPSRHEKFIQSDWLKLNFENVFDIVLGDGSMAMLSIEFHQKFLENVHKMIKPKGLAVLRIYIIAPLILDSVEKIFKWYRKNCEQTSIRIVKQYLYALWLDLDILNLDIDEYHANLLEVYKSGFINYEELEELDIIKNPGVQVQYSKKESFEQAISPLFEILHIDHAGDYPLHVNTPLYFLQKK